MALTVVNDNQFSLIDEINLDKASWSLKAKINKMWEVSNFNKATIPFSIELVLMDRNQNYIHASIRKTLIYKFKDELEEGKCYSFEGLGVAANGGAYRTTHHKYKLNFQYSSVMQRLANFEIARSPCKFVSIAELVGGLYDTDYLVDVIGFLVSVGQERQISNQNGTTTKLNVISLEAYGARVQCTLFGQYVDQLNAFLGAGDVDSAVVIIRLAKAKTFQDKIHIQNCMNCSVLLFNPTCEDSVKFRKRYIDSEEMPSPFTVTQQSVESSGSPADDFLDSTPRLTLQALKEVKSDSVNVVLATVKRILNPDSFWYTACVCSKAVIPDSKMFYCEKCNKHVQRVIPRFCIKVRVMDESDSANFVIFY